ncbi:MAG: CAP domain-containing protein, partial [Thermomicrobiales bacterium]
IARAHGEEMFELGYFSHDSPVSGSPFDRLNAAGIQYHAAGENLALAPDLDIAMQGLMNSPGHRANILSPDYGRVGIGIISSRYHGLMFVQLFRN